MTVYCLSWDFTLLLINAIDLVKAHRFYNCGIIIDPTVALAHIYAVRVQYAARMCVVLQL